MQEVCIMSNPTTTVDIRLRIISGCNLQIITLTGSNSQHIKIRFRFIIRHWPSFVFINCSVQTGDKEFRPRWSSPIPERPHRPTVRSNQQYRHPIIKKLMPVHRVSWVALVGSAWLRCSVAWNLRRYSVDYEHALESTSLASNINLQSPRVHQIL